jgi:putative ABC transport system substrate-binding protein
VELIARRRFLVAVAGAVAAPLAAEAQRATRVYRVGFVTLNPITGNAGPTLAGLRQGLKDLGYLEDTSLTIESRFADGRNEMLPALIKELLALRVDVLVTLGTPATVAAREMTNGPIVFIGVGNPVGSGFVASLAHPGGNLTGVSFVGPEVAAKGLELLKEAAPEASRVTVLVARDVDQQLTQAVWSELARVARVLQVTLVRVEVPSMTERLDDALAAMRLRPPDALLTLNHGFFLVHRARILATASALRLPTMFQTAEYVRAGGLLAFLPSVAEWGKQGARYIDRIFKGAKPADLPVEQPTKFELVINLKTAKTLGLTIPPTLLARADQIIE